MRTGARKDTTGNARLVPWLAVLLTLPLHAAPGGEMDVAPFGQSRHRGDEVVVEWTDPRDLVRVEAIFGEAVELPDPETVRLDYWQSRWPLERVPRGGPSGSGLAGWLHVGDPFQGEWKEADTRRRVSDAALVFTFNPVNAREFPELADDPTLSLGQSFDARYRTTYKVRLRSEEPLDEAVTLRAFTESLWREIDLEVLWREPEEGARDLSGSVEAFNGLVRGVSTVDDRSRGRSVSATEWRFSVKDRTEGIRLALSYAEPPVVPSADDTVVTVRSRRSPFSFRPRDVPDGGSLFVPDLGVLVRRVGSAVTYAEAHAAWLERRRGNTDLYTRVRERPEASLGAGAGRDAAEGAAGDRPGIRGLETARQARRARTGGAVAEVAGVPRRKGLAALPVARHGALDRFRARLAADRGTGGRRGSPDHGGGVGARRSSFPADGVRRSPSRGYRSGRGTSLPTTRWS